MRPGFILVSASGELYAVGQIALELQPPAPHPNVREGEWVVSVSCQLSHVTLL